MDYRLEQLRFQLQEDPTSRVFFKLGEHLRRIGELDEAVDVLRQGLDTHPHYVSAWVSLGRSLHDLGDTRGAWQAFSRACELDPENGVAARCAGEAAIANGEWVEAVKSLKRARGMMPQDDALDERIAFDEERLEELGLLEAPKPPPAPPPLGDEDGGDAVFEVVAEPSDAAEPDDVFESVAPSPDPDPEAVPASAPEPEPVPVPDESPGEPEVEFVDEPSDVIADEPSPVPEPVPVPVPDDSPAEPSGAFIDEPSGVIADESSPVPEPEPVPVPVPDDSPAEPELQFVDEPSGVIEDESSPDSVPVPDESPAEPSGVIADESFPVPEPEPVPVPDELPAEPPPPPPPDLMYQPEPDAAPDPGPPAAEPSTPPAEGPLPTMTLARLAVEQGDFELAESTARGVLERDPTSHEARQMLEWLDSKASADNDAGRTADGDARSRALRRWLDAVRLAAEKLES